MYRWVSVTLICFLCISVPAAEQGGGITTNPNTVNGIRFLALEEVERQEKLGRIQQGLAAEQTAHEERIRDFSQLAQQMRRLNDLPNNDQRMLACMQLRQKIQELNQKLKDDRANRLGIGDEIRVVLKQEGANEQAIVYLRQATEAIQRLLAETANQEATLKRQLVWLNTYMQRIPPPPVFVNSAGIQMILVSAASEPFYVSAGPITRAIFRLNLEQSGTEEEPLPTAAMTDLTRISAEVFCRRLSGIEGRTYTLPTKTEIRKLLEAGAKPQVAIWVADDWEPETAEERRMGTRFGVSFATIWDPANAFQDKSLVPDLAFAHYDTLGFLVTTNVEAGISARAKRLKALLQ